MIWLLLTLGSAFLFGLKDVVAKKFLKSNVTATQLTFEEFMMMFLAFYMFFSDKINYASFSNFWSLYLLKAQFLGFSTFIYFKLLKKHEISHVSPLLNLSPLILLIMSFLFLGEIITILQLSGILLMLFSLYFLELSSHHKYHHSPHQKHLVHLKSKDKKFYLSIFVLLLLLSLEVIVDKMIFNKGIDVYTNMFFTGLIVFACICFYYIYESYFIETIKNIYHEPHTLFIAFLAIISNALFLFALAIPQTVVSITVPLRRISTLFSSVMGGYMFHERHLKKKVLAAAVMFLGVFLILVGHPL